METGTKRVVAVDFDDVLMHFHGSFMAYHNRLYGTNLAYENLLRYDDWETLYGVDAATMTARAKEFYNSPEHALVPPIPGALEAIQRLARNYSLQIVTSRPDTSKHQVAEWLDRLFPNLFTKLHFTNSFAGAAGVVPRTKSAVCHEIGAKVLVDDALRHVSDVANSGIPALLPDRPWNRAETPAGVYRMHSWDDIAAWIERNV